MEGRLYRSRSERVIAGVAGGLGQYLGIDPVILRVLLVVLALVTGTGVLLYVVLWILVPLEPAGAPAGSPESQRRYRPLGSQERGLVFGGALVLLGLLLLARELGFLWWWIGWRHVMPLLLVAAGVALLIRCARSQA